MGDETRHGDVDTWSEYEARGGADLAALPDAVRAIVEECKEQSSTTPANPKWADGLELPYSSRMYESVPGEDDLLQLQWMRIDMSNMDSEGCWGETSACDEEYDCGPDSGLVLPAFYRVDPAQLFPLTFVGLPRELLRSQQGDDGSKQRIPDEMPEDNLCKLGRDVTEALSRTPGRKTEDLPLDVVAEVASLADSDWSVCLERHIDVQRCDPVVFAQVLSTRAPPTFDCLLGTVLPSLLAGISSRNATATSEGKGSEQSGKGPTGRGGRDEAAIFAICRLTASVASAGGEDPVRFRDRVSRSGLRKLGPGGMEAEVALAEAFFYRGAGGAT